MTNPLLSWIETSYRDAVQSFSDGHHSLAAKLAHQVLAALPIHDGAMHLLGLCALQDGKNEEAATWLLESLKSSPSDPQRRLALAMALKAGGDIAGAILNLRLAAEQDPANAQIRLNLANLLQDTGDFDNGLDCYRQAALLAPDNAQLRYNLGLTLLTLGQFEEGWREAEWRWKAAGIDLDRVDFKAPAWTGEERPGQTILLWAEQGLGDVLMFCRYVPLLAQKGMRVLLQTPRQLHPLLRSLEGLDGLFAEGDPLPAYDVQLPLLAVPGRMKTGLATIPGHVPYLKPPLDRQAFWQERLSDVKGLKIGLSWRGNPAHANDANRSLTPSLLTPLLDMEGISWIGLQPDPGPHTPPIFNAGPDLQDWGDSAGLAANLDLTISVDSSVAHLAGALGLPCWLMLPFLPDWRWMLHRPDSPWYPNMRLWRQDGPGAWDGLIRRLSSALRSFPR
ncbi:MAG: tetratricopeptide repeat protein [Rhodospirillales bacterium]|jgi:tetratricopeptide (TPR) repeat protein